MYSSQPRSVINPLLLECNYNYFICSVLNVVRRYTNLLTTRDAKLLLKTAIQSVINGNDSQQTFCRYPSVLFYFDILRVEG